MSHELTAYLSSIFNLFLLNELWPYYQKSCKPHNFELSKSVELSFTNIWGLCLNFADSESFLELNSPDILDLCETNLDDSIKKMEGLLFSLFSYLSNTKIVCSKQVDRLLFCKLILKYKTCVFKSSRELLFSLFTYFCNMKHVKHLFSHYCNTKHECSKQAGAYFCNMKNVCWKQAGGCLLVY